MGYNLYLDDVRLPVETTNTRADLRDFIGKNKWVVVRTYNQFKTHIKLNGVPDRVSFDHDLNREYHVIKDRGANKPLIEFPIDYSSYKEKTGWHAAKWLKKYCEKKGVPFPVYAIHSDNPNGTKNIKQLLKK